MNNKIIILTAQAISVLFSPFYFPVVAFVALFLFSYLNVLPLTFKVLFVAAVWLFTPSRCSSWPLCGSSPSAFRACASSSIAR